MIHTAAADQVNSNVDEFEANTRHVLQPMTRGSPRHLLSCIMQIMDLLSRATSWTVQLPRKPNTKWTNSSENGHVSIYDSKFDKFPYTNKLCFKPKYSSNPSPSLCPTILSSSVLLQLAGMQVWLTESISVHRDAYLSFIWFKGKAWHQFSVFSNVLWECVSMLDKIRVIIKFILTSSFDVFTLTLTDRPIVHW